MRAAYLATMFALLSLTTNAAVPECTTEPRAHWMSEAAFNAKLKTQGYQVKKFKVVKRCYEIYGTDKSGHKVEIYFNPVNGLPIKSRVDGDVPVVAARTTP